LIAIRGGVTTLVVEADYRTDKSMRTMPRVKLLIGPIASGKSTLTRRFADRGDIIVNDDAIVTAVHGGNYRLYNEKLKPLYKATEHSIIMSALSMGRDVVIDRPNFRESTRRRYIELARSFDVPTTGYIMAKAAPEEHAARRMKSDPRGYTLQYWIEVAKAHELRWQNPSMDEGFAGLIYVSHPDNINCE
jgi:predicted kinase